MKKCFFLLPAGLISTLCWALTNKEITFKFDYIPEETTFYSDEFTSESIGDYLNFMRN